MSIGLYFLLLHLEKFFAGAGREFECLFGNAIEKSRFNSLHFTRLSFTTLARLISCLSAQER